MAAARTFRNPMAPTAAPQNNNHNQQQQSYGGAASFPSPNSTTFANSPSNVVLLNLNVIAYSYYENFHAVLTKHVSEAVHTEEKCAIVESNFDYLQDQVLVEIRRLRIEFLNSQGLPIPHKRRNENDDDENDDSKKIKKADSEDVGSPEEEVNVKGSWRCLYYEEDPDSNFHCKDKRYKRVSELRRHIKTHTLPHYCEKCGYRTAEERRLQNHKCEVGNRKKYSPVSEEERLKHEQLARMGIKVGQMRNILFGKKGDGDDANGVDTYNGLDGYDGQSTSPSAPAAR